MFHLACLPVLCLLLLWLLLLSSLFSLFLYARVCVSTGCVAWWYPKSARTRTCTHPHIHTHTHTHTHTRTYFKHKHTLQVLGADEAVISGILEAYRCLADHSQAHNTMAELFLAEVSRMLQAAEDRSLALKATSEKWKGGVRTRT